MNTTTRFCSVCVGTGKPLSGLPCICGGAGTEDAELQGFRTALYDAHLKLEIMRAALEPARLIHAPEPQTPADSDTFDHGCSLTPGQVRKMQVALDAVDKPMDNGIAALKAEIQRLTHELVSGGHNKRRDFVSEANTLLAAKHDAWKKQLALTCSYIESLGIVERALDALVDAVNTEHAGGMSDIGGKTGPALIEAVNALAEVNGERRNGPVSKRLQELRDMVNELEQSRAKVTELQALLAQAPALPLVLGHAATAEWCVAVDAHHAATEERVKALEAAVHAVQSDYLRHGVSMANDTRAVGDFNHVSRQHILTQALK